MSGCFAMCRLGSEAVGAVNTRGTRRVNCMSTRGAVLTDACHKPTRGAARYMVWHKEWEEP